MIILRFLENKAFGGCKSQMFVLSYRITGREDGVCKPGRRSMSCRIQKKSTTNTKKFKKYVALVPNTIVFLP